MNKIISILVSLLFLASTFGVASATAKEISLCDYCYGGPDNITVQVGDTLLVDPGRVSFDGWDPYYEPKLIYIEHSPDRFNLAIDFGFFIYEELIGISPPSEVIIQDKIKALHPGTIKIVIYCMDSNSIRISAWRFLGSTKISLSEIK